MIQPITGVRQLLEGMGGNMEELTGVHIGQRLEEVGVARWVLVKFPDLIFQVVWELELVVIGRQFVFLQGVDWRVGHCCIEGELWPGRYQDP